MILIMYGSSKSIAWMYLSDLLWTFSVSVKKMCKYVLIQFILSHRALEVFLHLTVLFHWSPS